jgi:hypothetical protein
VRGPLPCLSEGEENFCLPVGSSFDFRQKAAMSSVLKLFFVDKSHYEFTHKSVLSIVTDKYNFSDIPLDVPL